MKKLLILIIALLFCSTSLAASDPCAKVKVNTLPQNTTIFVYEKIKNNKIFYIPILVMKDNQLTSIGKLIMPREVTLFNLHNNKPIKIYFRNSYNALENSCQSIGETKTSTGVRAIPKLYATQPLPGTFNFSPTREDIKLFQASIQNPCASNKPRFDSNGIMLCDDDKLIAVSHLLDQKQYWHTKQYRYDLGFGIDSWDAKTQKFIQIVEDCSVCSD